MLNLKKFTKINTLGNSLIQTEMKNENDSSPKGTFKFMQGQSRFLTPSMGFVPKCLQTYLNTFGKGYRNRLAIRSTSPW
jgi:hypothetical protein